MPTGEDETLTSSEEMSRAHAWARRVLESTQTPLQVRIAANEALAEARAAAEEDRDLISRHHQPRRSPNRRNEGRTVQDAFIRARNVLRATELQTNTLVWGQVYPEQIWTQIQTTITPEAIPDQQLQDQFQAHVYTQTQGETPMPNTVRITPTVPDISQVVSEDEELLDCEYSCEDCMDDLTAEEVRFYQRYLSEPVCFNCRAVRRDDQDDDQDSDDESDDDDSPYGRSRRASELGTIVHYGYKPDPLFHGDNGKVSETQKKGQNSFEPYFGIEVEVERKDSSIYRADAAKKIGELTKGLVYMKEDCSLNDGFEIVTHPMSLGYVQNHADGLWEALTFLRRAGYRSWTTSTCGLHIHISKNSFVSDIHQQKFQYFIFNNKRYLQKFAGRKSSFAKFDLESYVGQMPNESRLVSGVIERKMPSLLEIVKGRTKNGSTLPSTSWDRNLAVNRNPEFTRELRFFRPSLLPSTIMASIEFVHALYTFTEQVTAREAIQNKALSSIKPFKEYVEANATKYPALAIRLPERLKLLSPEAQDKNTSPQGDE